MSEIDGISSNSLYFAAVQNATREQSKIAQKEKTQGTGKKINFSDFLKKADQTEETFSTRGLPPEIKSMSLDEAVVFLKDAVDMAGNDLSSSFTMENLEKFKKSVGNFITFVVENNFEISKKEFKGVKSPSQIKASLKRIQVFSTYNDRPDIRRPPRIQIDIINKKLDELTKGMLSDQKNNLKMLSNINEIKGLVIDLLQG